MIDRTHFTNGLTADVPVPVGYQQTVPTERMATLLADLVGPADKVLEIGTGSGYQAALLAERCKEVVSIEISPVQGVSERLPSNVTRITADGSTYDTGEQFDAVLVTFGTPEIAPVWIRQLKDGGRLVIPLKLRDSCAICVFEAHGGLLRQGHIAGYAPFTEMQQLNGIQN